MNETDKTASTLLGKKVIGSDSYDPTLLVAVPRYENRQQYNIKNNDLPFEGYDIWHSYEFSCLTKNGIPVTRLMKMRYNSNNEYLVESKSLKLFLNSFNMMRFGSDINECLDICKNLIEKDLSEKLQTCVEVNFIDNSVKTTKIFDNFKNLTDSIDEKELKIEKFKESPDLLEVEKGPAKEYFLMFDSLRSNCRVTHQPDFGDVFIYYKSSKHIKESGLLKYLCSFRSEFHFHEECCEMIYKRLYDLLDENDELFVCALYTRRGGIDICPLRKSRNCTINDFLPLQDINKYARHGIKQ